MKQLKLRFARPEDAKKVLDWLKSNPANDFDEAILNYPSLKVVCAYNEDGADVAFMPYHNVKVLESTARSEEITEAESAQALRDFTKAGELMASSEGIRELYFLCRDESLINMAENHGYEVLPFKCLRMKLK